MTLVTDYPFGADAFRRRVQDRFQRRADLLQAVSGDNALNPHNEDEHVEREYKDAAVLIPVIDRGGEATVLLTQRSEHLNSHKGQIAFPGGKIDPGETPIEAAVREAHEEVGLRPDKLEVLGAFGDYFSGSGYRISPVVAMVKDGFSLKLSEAEVAASFEVPLSFLMSEENHQVESLIWEERERFFYAIEWKDQSAEPPIDWRIWGVTAGIIRMVHDRLYG